jgi:hypothetical protein
MVEPQLAPRGTSVQSFSASEMEVSWNAIAWNRNTGRVLGYEVIHMDCTLRTDAASHCTIPSAQEFVNMTYFLSYNSICINALLHITVPKYLLESI